MLPFQRRAMHAPMSETAMSGRKTPRPGGVAVMPKLKPVSAAPSAPATPSAEPGLSPFPAVAAGGLASKPARSSKMEYGNIAPRQGAFTGKPSPKSKPSDDGYSARQAAAAKAVHAANGGVIHADFGGDLSGAVTGAANGIANAARPIGRQVIAPAQQFAAPALAPIGAMAHALPQVPNMVGSAIRGAGAAVSPAAGLGAATAGTGALGTPLGTLGGRLPAVGGNPTPMGSLGFQSTGGSLDGSPAPSGGLKKNVFGGFAKGGAVRKVKAAPGGVTELFPEPSPRALVALPGEASPDWPSRKAGASTPQNLAPDGGAGDARARAAGNLSAAKGGYAERQALAAGGLRAAHGGAVDKEDMKEPPETPGEKPDAEDKAEGAEPKALPAFMRHKKVGGGKGMALKAAAGGNWIKGAIKRPGAVHKRLGVPKGQPLAPGAIEADQAKAKASGNTRAVRQDNLALTLKKMH